MIRQQFLHRGVGKSLEPPTLEATRELADSLEARGDAGEEELDAIHSPGSSAARKSRQQAACARCDSPVSASRGSPPHQAVRWRIAAS